MLIVQTESLWWEMTTTYKEIISSPINFYTLIKNCVPCIELISKRIMLSMLFSFTKYLCWFSFRIDIRVSCSEKFPHSSVWFCLVHRNYPSGIHVGSLQMSTKQVLFQGEKYTFRVQLNQISLRHLCQDKNNQTLGSVEGIPWFFTRFIGITGI